MNKQRSEREFIQELERRAGEQGRIVRTEIMPEWARGAGEWLVVNPWRVLVPLSALAYGTLRTAYGTSFREIVLGLFGGF